MTRLSTLMIEAAGTRAASFDRSGKLFSKRRYTVTRLYDVIAKKTTGRIRIDG
jgi:hypothetical protein